MTHMDHTLFWGALTLLFVILRAWSGLDTSGSVEEGLNILQDSNKTKGRTTRLASKFRRWLSLADHSWSISVSCLGDILRRLFIAVAFTMSTFVVVGVGIQPFLEHTGATPPLERVFDTGRLLGLGLIDALTFDLFSVAGVDLKINSNSLYGRILIWVFYILMGVIMADTLIKTLNNIWTAIVATVLPEPTLKVARTGKANTFLQRLVKLLTAL